jgi:benzoate membrane transport protein
VRFGLEVFGALRTDPWIVGPMVGAYFAVKRLSPRYAVTAVLLTGLGAAFAFGRVDGHAFRFELATPVLTAPAFTWSALTGLALPLALVTLTGQFVPGIAVLRTFGYSTPANPLVAVTSFVSVLLAPFGSHGVNLAAITAAICSGPAAHPQAERRYVAGVALGVAYVVAGLFGATLAGLFAALPASLIAALAGLALLGAIGNGLAAAMAAEGDDAREAALITFLVTASGISVLGLGSVVWGLLGGLLALAATRPRFRREAFPTAPPAAPRTATP